jgi:hypothetical protein
MAMSFSATPLEGLLPKVDYAPTCQLICLPLDAQLSQQPTSFQDSLLGQVDILQLLIYLI